eukprot:5358604-Amphidinium_carterae.1
MVHFLGSSENPKLARVSDKTCALFKTSFALVLLMSSSVSEIASMAWAQEKVCRLSNVMDIRVSAPSCYFAHRDTHTGMNSPLASGVSRSVSGHGLGVIALPPRRHGGNGQPAPSTPAMPARSYPIVNQVKGGFAPTSPGEVNRLSSKPASFVAAAPVATSADVCRVPSIQSEAIPEQPERSAGARLSAQPWQWERRSASGAGTPTPPAGFVLRNQSWQAPLIQKQPTSQPTRATTASAWKPPGMGSGVHHAPRRWDLPRTPEKVELQAGGV